MLSEKSGGEGPISPNAPATIEPPRSFMSKQGGQWAAQQFLRAAAAGKLLTPQALRTLETLRNEEWTIFDTAIVEGARMRLRGVQDLIAMGLTRTITNGLAKTILNWQRIGDMDDAVVSLDGITRSENDKAEFDTVGLPL